MVASVVDLYVVVPGWLLVVVEVIEVVVMVKVVEGVVEVLIG